MTMHPDQPDDALPLPGTHPHLDPWNYRPDAGWTAEHDLIGYHVHATDGNLGKVELDSHATGESYLVVDTGPWIFGSTVVIPAGIVTNIDHADRTVYLDRSKEQVMAAPEFVPENGHFADEAYRDKLTAHYGSGS
jgi:hypothetical protein